MPWNANIHYHPLLIDAIPRGARRVLDVGCGDGILSADLIRGGIPHVIGLDRDAGVLERAKARHAGINIEWIHGDLFDVPFEPASFDAVVSIATVHHMPAEKALIKFAELTKPHGVVALVGLAAMDWWDYPYGAIGYGTRLMVGSVRGAWVHTAPMVWPAPHTYREMKHLARRLLPGVRYRRHLLSRYSLIWKKP